MVSLHHTVLAPVSRCCSVPQGRFPRVTHPCATLSCESVRLACVRHAASVRSEPGSNSQVEIRAPDQPKPVRNPSRFASCTSASLQSVSRHSRMVRHANDLSRPRSADEPTVRAAAHMSLQISTMRKSKPNRTSPSASKRLSSDSVTRVFGEAANYARPPGVSSAVKQNCPKTLDPRQATGKPPENQQKCRSPGAKAP